MIVLCSLFQVLSTTQAHATSGANGGLFNYGDAGFYGSTGGLTLNRPVVGMAATPDSKGYWFVASDGGLFSYGDAGFYGSTGSMALNRPVVGMAATPDGAGYWLVASDGGVFSFGDAQFWGSTGSLRLNQPVVGMAATPDGGGYWLVAADGGVFSFGDAHFWGSTGSLRLNQPVVGMARTPDGNGYWMVAADGGIFSFGDARFLGSTGSLRLNEPVVGMAANPNGGGYWLVAADGGIFTYGDAGFFGSTGGTPLDHDVVGMAATNDGQGYWYVASDGGLSPPSGYANGQLIFDDQFSGTSLDTTKWNTYLGAAGITWNDHGVLPSPFSGPNDLAHGGTGYNAEMYGPSQVSVDNGLTLTAVHNTNQYAGTYPWLSGVVTTEGKFSLPTTGWYVQVKAEMPNQTQGMWPAIWFLPGIRRRALQRVRRLRRRVALGPAERHDAFGLLRQPGTAATGLQRRRRRDRRVSHLRVPIHPGPVGHRLLRRSPGMAGEGLEQHHHHRGGLRDHPRAPGRLAADGGLPHRGDQCDRPGVHEHRRGAGVLVRRRLQTWDHRSTLPTTWSPAHLLP